MNKRILAGVCGIAAAGMIFAGCGEDQAQELRFEWSNPTAVTTVATEPGVRYAFGDIVYTLEQWPDAKWYVTRNAVVSCEGDVIIATHAVSDTAEALRECLPEYLEDYADADPEEYLWQLSVSECYGSWEAAEAAAEALREG